MASSTIKINKNGKIVPIDISSLPIKDVLSYSRIDCFKSCEYKYLLKYIKKNYTDDSSLALRIGTILHLGLEYKYLNKYNNEEIIKIVHDGCIDNDKKVIGLNELKEEYPFEWEEEDKFGRTYDKKIKLYEERIKEDIEKEWVCIGCEVEFYILVENKAVIHGFIDRVDKNIKTGDIRVVDYKSSKKSYEKKELATPMQMFIYALACKELYGRYPSEFVYDMILIGEKQYAMTKGWEKRGMNMLNNKLNSLIEHIKTNNNRMKPSPSPLCYWCSYSETNPNATNGRELCEYYSLWKPEDKTFKKNKEWIEKNVDDNGWGDCWD